eukprot:1588228-Pyramimonas_sp.AAC.1
MRPKRGDDALAGLHGERHRPLSGGKGLAASAQRVEREREEASVNGAAAREALVIVMHAVVGHDARGGVASVKDHGERPSRAAHGAALGRT